MTVRSLFEAVRRHPRKTVATVSLIAVFTLAGFAALFLPPETSLRAIEWLQAVGERPWAPVLAVLLFVALITAGTPQVVLIAALVATFGPWAGFAYSWIGKVIACALGFYVGRRFGAGWLARNAAGDVQIVMEELARHGFWASAAIRLVPTLPSIVINVVSGCTPMRFRDFIAGTAVGSVPKMALMAYASHAALRGVEGAGLQAWVSVGGAVVFLIVLTAIGRRWLERRRRERIPE